MTSTSRLTRTDGAAVSAVTWLGAGVVTTGIAVLVGWSADVTTLKDISLSFTEMKANTAFAFVLAGGSLAMLQFQATRVLASIFAVGVLLIGAATLTEYVFDLSFGIDELLAHDDAGAKSYAAGRMSANTAISLMLTGVALLSIDSTWRGYRPATFAIVAIGISCVLTIAGYVYGVEAFTKSFLGPNIVPMSLLSALVFILLCAGIALVRPDVGVLSRIMNDSPGGEMLRRMIPPALAAPIVIGYLRLQGEHAGLYDMRSGIAIFAVSLVVLLVSTVWLTARSIDRVDKQRREIIARERALSETALDSVIAIDGDGAIREFNRHAEEMFGIARDEAIGRDMAELIIPQRFHAAHRQGLERIRENPETFRNLRLEAVAKRSDGTEFDAEIAIGLFRETSGTLVVGNVRDIRERKQLEAKLLNAQKLEAVGRLAGEVAQDFNDLLAVISGYTHLVRQEIGNREGMRELNTVDQATRKARDMTRQLLAISGQLEVERSPIDIGVTITEMAPMLRRLVGSEIEVLALDNGVDDVLGDPGQIEQALINLTLNARDAMPNGGTLKIESRNVRDVQLAGHRDALDGPYVCVSVTDTGRGIDPSVIDRIFEPFFSTKEVGHGNGLGLSTVFGIVTQIGGDIDVHSEPGHGTTFDLYLPATGDREPSRIGARTA